MNAQLGISNGDIQSYEVPRTHHNETHAGSRRLCSADNAVPLQKDIFRIKKTVSCWKQVPDYQNEEEEEEEEPLKLRHSTGLKQVSIHIFKSEKLEKYGRLTLSALKRSCVLFYS